MKVLKLLKPGKKPACIIPGEISDCEQGFLELLSPVRGKNEEIIGEQGKLIDVLNDDPDAVFPTPKEAV